MPTITLTIGQDGKPCGLGPEDRSHYARFKEQLKAMQHGDTMEFTYAPPRNPALHRFHFKMLGWVFENQEVFTSDKEFREWVERGARHVEVVALAGVDGVQIERVKSVCYAEMDGAEFAEHHRRVKAYLLSGDALKKLWPAVEVGRAYEALAAAIDGRAWEGGVA